jgi:hypothetical protein
VTLNNMPGEGLFQPLCQNSCHDPADDNIHAVLDTCNPESILQNGCSIWHDFPEADASFGVRLCNAILLVAVL